MNKKIISIFLVGVMIFTLMALTGCKKDKNELDPNKEYVKIYISDNGSTLDHEYNIILDESILKFKKSYADEDEKEKYKYLDGDSKSIEYYYEGIKEGKTEIWVVDMHPGEVSAITKYKIVVDSKLNAKIEGEPEMDYINCKSGLITIKDYENTSIEIVDNSIVRDSHIWRDLNYLNFVGLKEGSTIVRIKEKNQKEKQYKVNVDSNLNVVMEEF